MNKLRQLATWAQRFTPIVNLHPPQALLLEISASLRLFGGLNSLKKAFNEGLPAAGAHAHIMVTPTPLASLLLASQGQSSVLTSLESIRPALSRLPVSVLPLTADAIRRLLNIGARDLQDLWRLPRAGLTRRYGPELLSCLDRALGVLPDPRSTFQAPPRFTAELELPWETEDTARLLKATRRLLARLVKFLRAYDAGVTRLRLDLHHARFPPSRLRIGTNRVARAEAHLLRLLEEHLHHLRLPAPVLKLELTTAAIEPFTVSQQNLFARYGLSKPAATGNPLAPSFTKRKIQRGSEPDWWQLLEQLQARLGRETVVGIEALADHRPEWAWNFTQPSDEPCGRAHHRRRPLWLLSAPKPLALRHGHPWRRGPLSVTKGVERIESGWWDSRDVRRDYYLARDIDGSQLWIFRDLRRRAWYLHGVFG